VKKLSETSDVSLQLYYDHSESSKRINKNQNDYFEKNDKIDIEFQHSFSPFKRQKIVWGSGIRFTSDSLPANSSTYNPIFLPASKDQHLFSAFLQDSIDIINDRLTLIIGSRIEHQDIIGWDIQPTARISYTPNRFHTIWGAVSRSVRTPSRAETSISAVVDFIPPTTEVRIFGNNRVSPEIVVSYETGYRVAPINTLYFDSVFFYNDYSRLIGLSAGAPTQTLMPINSATTSNGHTKGVELSANWKPENFARFKMLYSYIDESFSSKESLAADSSITYTNTTPRNQWSMLGSFDLPQNLYLDLWVRYVDSIGKLNVDDYATFDARIAWRPIKNLEISLVGQNLVEANHQEYGTDIFGNSPAQVPRSVYGKVIWEF